MVAINRRAKAVLAIVSAAAIALTGCSRGSGDDSAGVAGADEPRVASLGLGDADTVLALGLTPVAVAPWGAKGDGDPSGVGPWAKELLGDAQPEVIYNTASGFTAEVLEQVTASDPTQIIAVNQAVDQEAKKSLEDIAPLTVKPEGFEDWQVPWEEQVKTIASAVDKEEEGEKLIDQAEDAFAQFKDSHPELQGKRAAIVMPYEGKLGLYTPGDGRGQFIEDLSLIHI